MSEAIPFTILSFLILFLQIAFPVTLVYLLYRLVRALEKRGKS